MSCWGRVRASRTRSGASTPPPAPWVSTSIAIGRLARRTSSRASPLGVGTIRSTGISSPLPEGTSSRGRSSSGRGSTSSGPLFLTLDTSVETGNASSRPGAAGSSSASRSSLPFVARVEPGVVPLRGEHQRHPVVDVAERVLRAGGQHGAGPPEPRRVVLGLGRVAPDLVEPGHRQHATVGRPDEVGLLARLPGLGELLGRVPLEVAVRRQDRPPLLEGAAVGRLLGDRLHPGVDHPVADLGVLGPERHQPPGQHAQLALRSTPRTPSRRSADARRRRRPPWWAPR